MILVVDDNTANQYVARVVLEKFGHKAHIVDNGHDAITAAAQGQYDLILMDCRMPICDGYEATEAIRRMQAMSGRHCPIIGVTACAMEGDRERCFASGMDDYVTKPVSLEVFRDVLERWLPQGQKAMSS